MSKRGAEWYKREPRAFLEGVRRMTEREIAVYAVILDLMYDAGHDTYDDPKHIASYFSDLGSAAVRKAIDALVEAGKLTRKNGKLTNKRAETEGKTREELKKKRQEIGQNGGVSSGISRSEINEINDINEANSTYTRAIDEIREEVDNIEPKGSLSETSSDASSEGKKRKVYSEQFVAFWTAYPRTPNMSKSKAFDGFRKLTQDERRECFNAVPAYKAFLASKPDHPIMHATTFINERRFEGFAPEAAAPIDDATWSKRLNFGRTKNQWQTSIWGPAPTNAGCLVPVHLLQSTDGAGWREWSKA